jgi:hypothetical protein
MKNTLVKTTLMARQIGLRDPRPGEVGPQPIWLAQGGSEDDASDADNDDAGGDDDADDENDADDAAGAGAEDKKTKRAPTQAEYDRVQKHLSNADRKKQAAETRAKELAEELRQLKTKDLPDAERVKAEHESVVAERDSYKTKFEKLARTNAFLLASESAKVTWANSSAALKVGDLEDLEIEEDGTVVGMVDAVKELAKAHPYLLAPKDSTEKDTKDTSVTKSGSVVGSKVKGKKTEQELSDDEIRRRFPSLYR